MSEKMYEAIYKVAKTSESDSIVLWMDKVEIKGTLLDCEDNKCIKDIYRSRRECYPHLLEAAGQCGRPWPFSGVTRADFEPSAPAFLSEGRSAAARL